MRLCRMARCKIIFLGTMTRYTTACSAYRMTSCITDQAAVRAWGGCITMTTLTVVLMDTGDDVYTAVTRRTLCRTCRGYHRCMGIGCMACKVGINTGVTVDTTAGAANHMTTGTTGQRTVGAWRRGICMTALTVVLMNTGDHCAGMTRDTICSTCTRQLGMRLRRMTSCKIIFLGCMTVYTTTRYTDCMTRSTAR